MVTQVCAAVFWPSTTYEPTFRAGQFALYSPRFTPSLTLPRSSAVLEFAPQEIRPHWLVGASIFGVVDRFLLGFAFGAGLLTVLGILGCRQGCRRTRGRSGHRRCRMAGLACRRGWFRRSGCRWRGCRGCRLGGGRGGGLLATRHGQLWNAGDIGRALGLPGRRQCGVRGSESAATDAPLASASVHSVTTHEPEWFTSSNVRGC